MKLIKKLIHNINEELHDAEKYIDCALAHQHDGSDLNSLFTKLAAAELDHANWLHEAVVKEIDKFKSAMHPAEHPPAYMVELWEEMHEDYIEKLAVLRHKLDLARK